MKKEKPGLEMKRIIKKLKAMSIENKNTRLESGNVNITIGDDRGTINTEKDNLDLKAFKTKISWDTRLNLAFFKIFSDYFNMLKQDKKLAKQHGISNVKFFRQKCYHDSIDLVEYWDETNASYTQDKVNFNFSFDRYKYQSEILFTLYVNSEETTNLENEVPFKRMLKNALSVSNLRGSYIEMPRNEFSWKRKELEKRGFDDIFLPNGTMDDLKLYIDVFSRKDRMMRYLMVGNPGTGKTESTLIISNELKNKGVTILKTPVCDLLKEKIELAEALAPTILLFDDLDLSIGSRTKGGYSPKELQTFLDAMDGTDKISKGVGIIATTNSSQLLDLAAQRPGRFEKLLAFDSLTKDNIKNIILKSLKYNADMTVKNSTKKEMGLFCNTKVINKFSEVGATGAHVFNSINVLKLKADMTDDIITLKWVLDELENDLNVIEKIRTTDHLTNKVKHGGNGKVGFTGVADEGEYDYDLSEEYPEDEKCAEEVDCGPGSGTRSKSSERQY